MGEDRRRTSEDRTDELIAELRDRVRSLENQLRQERAANRENRRIIASLTSRAPERPAPPVARRAEPAGRRIRSWWKEKFGAAMVGVATAFAVLSANGGENPLRVGGGEQEQTRVPTPSGQEQARVPTPTTTEPAPTNTTIEPVASEPAPEPEPIPPTDPSELEAQSR